MLENEPHMVVGEDAEDALPFRSLPEDLQGLIFGFIVVPPDEFMLDEAIDARWFLLLMQGLGRVSKAWRIYSLRQYQRWKYSFRKVNVEDMQVPMEAVETALALNTRGPMTTPTDAEDYTQAATRAVYLSWRQLLRPFKNIIRLEVTYTAEFDVPQVIKAAASECALLQAFVIRSSLSTSCGFHEDPTLDRLITSVLDELELALRQWHVATRGLRWLTFPEDLVPDNATADRLLALIAAYCPHIEGFASEAFAEWTSVRLPTWQSFWETCSAVRVFNMQSLRWNAALCRAFATTPKPTLQVLFVHGGNWDWPQEDPTLLSELVQAIPNLKELHLGGDHVGNQTPNRGTQADELVCLAATYCRQLRIVNVNVELMLLSGVSMRALASAKSVRVVCARQLLCERNLLSEMFQRFPMGGCVIRAFHLQSGFGSCEMFVRFFQFLASYPADQLADVRLRFRFVFCGDITQHGLSPETLDRLARDIWEKHRASVKSFQILRNCWREHDNEAYVQGVEMHINMGVPTSDSIWQ